MASKAEEKKLHEELKLSKQSSEIQHQKIAELEEKFQKGRFLEHVLPKVTIIVNLYI